MSELHKRGIHKASLLKSMQDGKLSNLLNLVGKNKDFAVLIRDDYFNVYHRGGNVANVSSDNSVKFDMQYFRQHRNHADEDLTFMSEQINNAVDLFKNGQYQAYLDLIVPAMNNYFRLGFKSDEEKETQHQLCVNNTFESSSEFTIIDLEYEVSTESKFAYCGKRTTKKSGKPKPRFDIVTVRKSDGKICIMELKKGTKALENKSGIGEHAESFEHTVGFSKERQKLFVDEMKGVLNQMKSLHLINENVEILHDEVEYMFVFQEKNSDRTANQVQVFREKMASEFRKYNIQNDYQAIELHDGDYTLRYNRL